MSSRIAVPVWFLLGVLSWVVGQPVPAGVGRDGEVHVHGSLRAMFHEGKTGAEVELTALFPNPALYGIGALADLAGEITILGGVAYLSYPAEAGKTRDEMTSRPAGGAALLVLAEVENWRALKITREIPFEEIDREIRRLAESAGWGTDRRFPFLIEGDFDHLEWHVIDGSRVKDGGKSHGDHLAGSVRFSRPKASATILGFYSGSDQGVFTHMGSTTHMHVFLPDPVQSGHVDRVTLPAGTTVSVPATLEEVRP